MKRDDFRDALRLIVLNLAKRFNRKMAEADVNEYVDDLMFDLKPAELAQLPALLATSRRDNAFFPSTGEIREKVERLALPAPEAVFIPYSYPPQLLKLLPDEAREALESSKKTQGRRDKIPEADIRKLTDGIKADARRRRSAEVKQEKAGKPQKGPGLVRLGEGLTEKQFRDLLDRQKQDFLKHNRKGTDETKTRK